MSPFRLVPLVLALAACGSTAEPRPASARGQALLGRWQKVERSLPPLTLEVRPNGAFVEGQVWLSGVTYTLPGVVDDTMVVLARPESSAPAPVVGVLERDGRLRVRLRGDGTSADIEERLVRMP